MKPTKEEIKQAAKDLAVLILEQRIKGYQELIDSAEEQIKRIEESE